MAADIDERLCPRCGLDLGADPIGSLTVPYHCLPVCSDCRRVEEYRNALMIRDGRQDPEAEEEILSQLKLQEAVKRMLDDEQY